MGSVIQYPASGGGGLSPGNNNITGDTSIAVTGALSLSGTTALTLLSESGKFIIKRSDLQNDTTLELGDAAEGFANINGADSTLNGFDGVGLSINGGTGKGSGRGGSIAISAGWNEAFTAQMNVILLGAKIMFNGPITPAPGMSMTTTERDALPSVSEGMMIYNTTIPALQIRIGGAWKTVTVS